MTRAKRRQRPNSWLRGRSQWIPVIGASLVLLALFSTEFLRKSPEPISEIQDAFGVPEELAAVLAEVFDEQRCTSVGTAKRDLRQRLDAVGYVDWSIASEPNLPQDSCVSWSLKTSQRTVQLVSALSPEVSKAMQQVTYELIDRRCLGEDEAIAYVTSVLTRLGQANFEVRTDGPLGFPLDRVDEALAHVQAGCWIYTGTGRDKEHRLFFVSSEQDLPSQP